MLEKAKRITLKGSEGYTLVELITVLAIIAILGTMLLSLLNLGVKFYSTEDIAMENQNDARLAIAYMTVKIRQNDVIIKNESDVMIHGISDSKEKMESSDNKIDVLKIIDTSSATNSFFWIYFDEGSGKLREQHSLTFNKSLNSGTEIADLSSVVIEQHGANIIHLEVKSKDSSVILTQDITLRSSP